MDVRYPIGTFNLKSAPSSEEITSAIDAISEAPAKLRAAVEGLSSEQLDTPYRPGGGAPRQRPHPGPVQHFQPYWPLQPPATLARTTIKAFAQRWVGVR